MAQTELMDPTAARIVLAAQRGDSIRRIAQKIGTAYSWVNTWVKRLDDADIISYTDNTVRVVDHEMRRQYDAMMGTLYRRDTVTRDEAYIVPHFAGMEFAYTALDAAYVWTHGGYQIARSHDDHPIFIRVHDQDVERWIAFFERYGIDVFVDERPDADEVEDDIYFVLRPTTDGVERDWVDGTPVIPLNDAVDMMMEQRSAYEPALEIIAEEHDVDVEASHQ